MSLYFPEKEKDLELICTYLNTGKFVEIDNKLIAIKYVSDLNISEIHKQILLTIHTYCLLKLKKYETAKSINQSVNFQVSIFPYLFIIAKLNYIAVSQYNC